MFLRNPPSPAFASNCNKCLHSAWRVLRRFRTISPVAGSGAGQFKEVLPVAGEHDGLGLHRMVPDVHVIGSDSKYLRDQQHLMACLPQAPGGFDGHVLVNQESHSSRCAVWAATKGSISP